MAIGSIEPQFYRLLLEATGLAGEDLPAQLDRAAWPALHARLAAVFRTRTRAECCAIMEGTDICFAPVLTEAGFSVDEISALRTEGVIGVGTADT